MLLRMNPKKRIERFCGDFIPVILGATASGKSSLALETALVTSGEILCCDSMQLYRGLDRGTAKASPEEQALVPHHLINTLSIGQKSDIFQFCTMAEQAVADILRRGKRPVLEGGSGLYLHAFLYGLDQLPAKQSLRDELDARFDNEEHFPELCRIMAEKAPLDFQKFGEHRRKLIRAYEVFLLSGKQISELQSGNRVQRPGYKQFFLVWDRQELCERIRIRTKQMLASGWIEEAEALIKQGLLQTPTAWQALGYSLIGEYLKGTFSRDELEERIVIATRQYARRQCTWFRNRHPDAEPVMMPLAQEG